MRVFVVQLLISIVGSGNYIDCLKPIVKTKVGLIRGVRAADGNYDMFMGIPYARVNMSNPFGDSLPYPKFQEIFEANNDSAQCIQIHDIHGLGGSLDCLQLNIYVPSNINLKDLPVMVYIFGGSFVQGFFAKKYYGPRFLMRYGVILVVMNYRVGSYGTVCLDSPEAPGNQALKDQVSALKWIQDNIKDFRGDPGKVTLVGHSGGAVSVSLQVIYAKEKLFHRAIIMSGSAFHPKIENKPNNDSILKLSKYLGFDTENVKEAIYFVSTVDPNKVVQAEKQIEFKSVPCRESEFENVASFMTEFPKNVDIKDNTIIPILIGNSGDEMNYLFAKKDPKYFEENNWIHDTLKSTFNFKDKEFIAAYELVSHFYIDEAQRKVTKRKFIDFISDFYFIYPNKKFIDKCLKKGAKIYYYLFPYSGGRNLVKNLRNLTNTLATHGDELGYMFDVSFPFMNKDRDEDYVVLDNFLRMLTNFAKYGDPTPIRTNSIPIWKPISNGTWYYMNIEAKLSLRERPFHQQIAFWDQFYKSFGHLENNV